MVKCVICKDNINDLNTDYINLVSSKLFMHIHCLENIIFKYNIVEQELDKYKAKEKELINIIKELKNIIQEVKSICNLMAIKTSGIEYEQFEKIFNICRNKLDILDKE